METDLVNVTQQHTPKANQVRVHIPGYFVMWTVWFYSFLYLTIAEAIDKESVEL